MTPNLGSNIHSKGRDSWHTKIKHKSGISSIDTIVLWRQISAGQFLAFVWTRELDFYLTALSLFSYL